MVERKDNWEARPGVGTVVPPFPPIRPPVGCPMLTCPMLTRARYDQDYSTWMEYAHLVKVGKEKLLTWFGKDVFESLHIRRQLPSHLTPCDLLECLTEVFAPEDDHRRHIDKVEAMVKTFYNPTKLVEAYFATLQNAKDHTILLGIPYSKKQLMYRAMTQFKNQLTREQAGKIERKWLEMPATTCM